jgi:hypothetical protein
VTRPWLRFAAACAWACGCAPPTDDTCENAACPARQHCELRSEDGSETGEGAVATCVPDPSCDLSTEGAFACPSSMTCESAYVNDVPIKACIPSSGEARTCTELGSCPPRAFCQIVETSAGESAACVGGS